MRVLVVLMMRMLVDTMVHTLVLVLLMRMLVDTLVHTLVLVLRAGSVAGSGRGGLIGVWVKTATPESLRAQALVWSFMLCSAGLGGAAGARTAVWF